MENNYKIIKNSAGIDVSLVKMGIAGFSCECCGTPVQIDDFAFVCQDCGAVVCESCTGGDFHECEPDEE